MLLEVGSAITRSISKILTSTATDQQINECIDSICTTLIRSNVSIKYVNEMRVRLKTHLSQPQKRAVSKGKAVEFAVFNELVKLLDPKADKIDILPKKPKSTKASVSERAKSKIMMFVGLQGAGKTTSLCKIANYYKRKGYKVGVVCADTIRAGAYDQIRQNALKIKTPFYGSPEATNAIDIALKGIKKFKNEGFDLILIDTSGRHKQEKALYEEMAQLQSQINPDKIVFVMDAGIGQSAESQALAFKEKVKVGSIVLSKIDSTNKAGGAISAVAATNSYIEFVGTGEGMEDLTVFDPRRFVRMMLGGGDLEGLAEKVKDLGIDEKKITQKLRKGNFLLNDFYEQFKQLLSLGPISKVLAMLPGGNNMPNVSDDNIKRFIFIFDSFSKKELFSTGEFITNKNRIRKIALGSGTAVIDVKSLVEMYKKISNAMRKISKTPGLMEMMNNPEKMTNAQRATLRSRTKGMFPSGMFEQFFQ